MTAVRQPACQPPHPHLHILQCLATHGMLLLKDVYLRRWRTHNMPKRRIYTSVAANVLSKAFVNRCDYPWPSAIMELWINSGTDLLGIA